MTSRLALAALLFVVVAVPVAGAQPATTATVSSTSETHVVDVDGGDYATIQSAVDAADPGDTVRVMPGTYRETVTLDADITLVAPRGVTLDGSSLGDDTAGIEISGDASVVVERFTITGYTVAVDASGAGGDWTLLNTTIADVGFIGVYAPWTTGDWRVSNVTVQDADTGVDAGRSTGDWVVSDAVVRNTSVGVQATASAGGWTLRRTTVEGTDAAGVEAMYTTGDWRVVNTAIRDTTVGIGALGATGNWSVKRSTVANASDATGVDYWQPPLANGAGIDASGTNGSWSVHRTRFVGNAAAIVADDTDPQGDATCNWFGDPVGPDAEDCTGNVDCSEPLDEWPPDPSERSATATSPRTPDETAPDVTTATQTPYGTTPTATPDAPTTTLAGPSTPTPTTTVVPLSPGLALVGTLLAGLVVARRRR